MNINKAIKKQKSKYRLFKLAMYLIFIILPLCLFFLRDINILFIVYLIVIEMLIILSLVYKKNSEFLNFQIDNVRVKIQSGFPIKQINLFCENIDVVHAEGTAENIQVILITKAKMRNKLLRPIDEKFFINYPYAGHQYGKIKKINPENEYCYTVVKNGGFKKYLLLDELYRSCTGAYYTEETIDQIKLYRNSK